MSLMDTIVTMLIKRGVAYDARNTVLETEIPNSNIKVKITIDHMTIKLEKGSEA